MVSMRMGLEMKMSQQLIMTPQLQQAIKLLQLSRVELEELIDQALIENPTLEVTPNEKEEEESNVRKIREREKEEGFEIKHDKENKWEDFEIEDDD